MDISIRSAKADDASSIAGIYNHYVSNTLATFETELVTTQDMVQRVSETLAFPLPWLVAAVSGEIVGYAYASKWKGRCAYRFSVESSIYLAVSHTGKGIGLQLYTALIDEIRAASMHSAIGGIALPNEQSIQLHERLGFKKVAHFKQVGHKLGRWIDVGYWQLLL